MYGKLFASMFDGSLYGNWQAIVTFQQMIILCGPDGVIDVTPQALAARTSIPLDIIQEGLRVLEAPDQYSRTPDHDGRRIERLDDHRPWGWRIVNYRKYRMMVSAEEKREADRVRIAEKRKNERDGARQIATKSDKTRLSQVVAEVAQAEAEAEAEVLKERERGTCNAESVTGAHAARSPAASKPKSDRASRLQVETLPDEWREFCRSERPDLDPTRTFARFADYWRAKAGKDGRKLDWLAAWRNWVRSERAPTWTGPPKPAESKDGPAWMSPNAL